MSFGQLERTSTSTVQKPSKFGKWLAESVILARQIESLISYEGVYKDVSDEFVQLPGHSGH